MSFHPTQPEPQPRLSKVAGWTLLEYDRVDSTNFVIAKLGAWHAVRADTQTAGRGRFQRSWISDEGGLWLSAAVPTGPDRERWKTLPLVAGLAVIDALRDFGVTSLRLRWPNDIMVNERKLAGLLVDNFAPKFAAVGLGVNVTNHPAKFDDALKDSAMRLADLVPHPPPLAALTAAILVQLRAVIDSLTRDGFSALRPRLNQLWGGMRRVALDLDGIKRSGVFAGVDDQGRLLLQDAARIITALEPHQVRLLREI